MSFTLKTLTEGIRDRHVGQQNKRLVEKWSRTGLLRGMDDVNRENMATLLENQAAQVLRESNTMGGDAAGNGVGGFTNIAFPIVRRVFGGLIANELVSIQPMSLPSGLLFYLDYTYGSDQGPYSKGDSIYGGPTGKAIQSGALATGGQYDLVGSGFSRHYKELDADKLTLGDNAAKASSRIFSVNGSDVEIGTNDLDFAKDSARGDLFDKLVQFDTRVLEAMDNSTENYKFMLLPLDTTCFPSDVDLSQLKQIRLTGTHASFVDSTVQEGVASTNVRRLNRIVKIDNAGDASNPVTAAQIKLFEDAPLAEAAARDTANHDFAVLMVCAQNGGAIDTSDYVETTGVLQMSYPVADTVGFSGGGEADGTPSFESDMAGDNAATGKMGVNGVGPIIPEIDIKIESIPVTAQSRKLRARWSPELAQDLNAYHSMDAEVELTQILSEQIALEIDREILGDLLAGAAGANFFWSRSPGKFVNKRTGAEIARTSSLTPGPAFTGTVREWYETLTETVIDVANEIHRKTLRGSANFIVVSPDVATILEASVLYRPSYSLDGDGQVGAPFTMGAEKVGTLSNRFTVYKDPYFPRNKILVGYKGGSYLETGFVYAPYVPLIVTPTIFQPDDFTPRKGVMTRYGKKMVRADFYGTVTCLDMNII
jgi:hypothetical protein